MTNDTVAIEAPDAQIVITTQGEMVMIQGTAGLDPSDFKLILRAALEAIEADEENDAEVFVH